MKIMVYSRIARLWIEAGRTVIRDLAAQPISDELLRQVRRRIMEQTEGPATYIAKSRDFSTLAGTHDLLLPRHEDPFDIPRITRTLDRLGLRLLSFVLPTPDARARYEARFPHDVLHRDVKCWAVFEKDEPRLFEGMYEFWCRKRADSD
jgi:hypothetical protein